MGRAIKSRVATEKPSKFKASQVALNSLAEDAEDCLQHFPIVIGGTREEMIEYGRQTAFNHTLAGVPDEESKEKTG